MRDNLALHPHLLLQALPLCSHQPHCSATPLRLCLCRICICPVPGLAFTMHHYLCTAAAHSRQF
jgi:hypothetical protein